jgi:hypothetical protein
MWYAAHVIMAYRYCEGEQDKFPVQENVFLIEANSSHEAHRIAVKIGEEEGRYAKPSAVYNEVPVRLTFEGVRKVVECLPADRIGTGTELTYTEFLVDSKESLKKLVSGGDVTVTLQDFADDAPPAI